MKRRIFISLFAACAAFASCDDGYRYDDTELWETIGEIKDRLTALEKTVQDNVAAIQSMVSLGSIKSWEFDAETGKGTITLLDGKTIVVDQTVKGYSLMTVEKGSDGKYYWAICQDGVSTPLEIDGKKVPVAVTPALKISEDKEWLISVDGGATWVSTGIRYQEMKEGESEDAEVVFFKEVVKDGDYLVLTLVDGTEVKVEVVGEASVTIASEALWFSRTGMEKSVAVEMVNVKAYTITEKPEGWKARIEEGYLFVTSPDDFAKSPKKGTVKVLALFAGGLSPEILSLEVSYEPSFSLSYMNRKLSVSMSENTGEDFNGYVLAGWKADEYDPENAAAWLNSNAAGLQLYQGSGQYELSEIIEDYDMTQDYVVFAVPYLPPMQVTLGNMSYVVADIQSVSCKGFSADSGFEFSQIRFDSAWLTAYVDAESYYGGFMKLVDWNNYGMNNFLETLSYDGGISYDKTVYDGPANAFPDGEIQVDINPATEYVAWYIPVKEGKNYTEEDFVTYSFVTPDVSSDASIAAPSFVVRDVLPFGFTADVTPASGAYKTYASILKAAAVPETEIEAVRYLIYINQFSSGSEVNTVVGKGFSPEDEVYLLAVTLTEDGRYGSLVKEKVALKELTYLESLGVSVSGIQYGLGDVTLSLEYKGEPETLSYLVASYTYYDDETMENLLALHRMGDATVSEITKVGGKIHLTGLTTGTLYTFYAVVHDAEYNSSRMYKYDFIPTNNVDYILDSDSDYEYGMPQLTGSWSSKTIFYLDVTKPQECVQYWLFKGDAEYFTGDPWTDSDYLVTRQYEDVTVHETSVSGMKYSYMNNASRIYMVWMDIKGNFHAIYEFNPHKLK